MNKLMKLAKIYVDTNCWRWNDALGEKPENFDTLPDFNGHPCKSDYIHAAHVVSSIAVPYWIQSWAWWKYECKETNFLKWFWWYITHKHWGQSINHTTLC